MIHKEGRLLLVVLLIVFAGANYAAINYIENGLITNLIILTTVVLFLLVLQFFRNPPITIKTNDKAIYVPADGKVVVIEEAEETEFLNEKRKQVSIFMSPINVHVNRNPVSGLVKYFKYHPGKYLVAWHPKSSTENERTTIVYETEKGTQILIRQIAGALARRIKWYLEEGQKVDQGSEFGFIKFGSRVDLYLPLDAEIKVEIDQKTKGGRTVIAELA